MNWRTYKTSKRGLKPSEDLSHYFSSSDESLDNDLLEDVQSGPVSTHKHIFRIPERPKKIRQSLVNRKKIANSAPMHQPQKTFQQSLPLSPVENGDDEVTLTKSRRNSFKISKQSGAPINVLSDDLSCHLDSDLFCNTLIEKDQQVPGGDLEKPKSHKRTTSKMNIIESRVINGANKENLKSARGRTGQKRNKKSIPEIFADTSDDSQVVQERRRSKRQKKERVYHYNPSTLLIDSEDLLEYTFESKGSQSWFKQPMTSQQIDSKVTASNQKSRKRSEIKGNTSKPNHKTKKVKCTGNSNRVNSLLVDVAVQTDSQPVETVVQSIIEPSKLIINSPIQNESERLQSRFKQVMTLQQTDSNLTASNQKPRKCSEIKENTSKPNGKTKKVKGTRNSNTVNNSIVDVTVQKDNQSIETEEESEIEPANVTINRPIRNGSRGSQSWFKQAMTSQQTDSNITVSNQKSRKCSEIKENTSKPNGKTKKVKGTRNSNTVNNSIVDVTVQKDNQSIETEEESEIEPANVTINRPIRNGSRGSQSWFKQAMTSQQTDSNITVSNQKPRKSSEIKENTSKPNGKTKKVKGIRNSNRVNNSIVDVAMQKDSQPVETEEEAANVTINTPIQNGSRGSQSWFKQAMTSPQTDSNITVSNQKPRKSSEIKENTSKPNGKTKKVKGIRNSNRVNNSIIDVAMQKDSQSVETEVEAANVTINTPIQNGSRGLQSRFTQAMTSQQIDSKDTASNQKPRKCSEIKGNTSKPIRKTKKVKDAQNSNSVNNSIVDITVQKDNQPIEIEEQSKNELANLTINSPTESITLTEVKNNSPTVTGTSTQINHMDLKDTLKGDNLNNSKGQPNPQIYSDSKLRNYFYFPVNNKVSKITYCFRDFPLNTTGEKKSLQIARRCKSSHAGFESGLLEIQPGQAKMRTVAVKFSKVFLVLEGNGLFCVHDSYSTVKCGAEVYVPLGASYYIGNQSQTEKLLLHYIKMYPQGS